MTGNHLADQADRERERKGCCPDCRVLLKEVECEESEPRLKCPRCGGIFEMED